MSNNSNFSLKAFKKIEDIIYLDEPILSHLKLNEKDYLLYLVDNFITLLLILEFVSILYYFFFLQQVSTNIRSYIKLKNLLNTYL